MRLRRLPPVLAVVTLSSTGCSGPSSPGADAGTPDSGLGDGGCRLPSDFPPDASQFLIDAACSCPRNDPTFIHCPEEGGPRCFSWACYPEGAKDGGYSYTADGGLSCLC